MASAVSPQLLELQSVVGYCKVTVERPLRLAVDLGETRRKAFRVACAEAGESHDHAIRLKAEIMVDHFHDQVIALKKAGGQTRAMVVTRGIERAVQYYHAFCDYLKERKSPYRAIVAFSGEHELRPQEGHRGVTQRVRVEQDR